MEHVPDADAWLYCRGEESIRMTRTAMGKGLLTYGPGKAERRHEFPNVAALDEFLESYRQRLLREGWTLAIVAERRQMEEPVPPEHERRARQRRAISPPEDE